MFIFSAPSAATSTFRRLPLLEVLLPSARKSGDFFFLIVLLVDFLDFLPKVEFYLTLIFFIMACHSGISPKPMGC